MNFTAEHIHRTGNAMSPFRQLVIEQGTGKTKVEQVLPTPIFKVQWGLQFRHGTSHKPVEQYAFKVDGLVYERFADATAVVLMKHDVQILALVASQVYVRKALRIMVSEEPLRVIEMPETAGPAIGRVGRAA